MNNINTFDDRNFAVPLNARIAWSAVMSVCVDYSTVSAAHRANEIFLKQHAAFN